RLTCPSVFFLAHHAPPTDTYTLSLHDALPICSPSGFTLARATDNQRIAFRLAGGPGGPGNTHGPGGSGHRPRIRPHLLELLAVRSEEHTSELQSRENLVCRLLLEKKKQEKHHK